MDRIKTIFRTLSKATGPTQWAYPSTHQNGWPDSITLKLCSKCGGHVCGTHPFAAFSRMWRRFCRMKLKIHNDRFYIFSNRQKKKSQHLVSRSHRLQSMKPKGEITSFAINVLILCPSINIFKRGHWFRFHSLRKCWRLQALPLETTNLKKASLVK